MDTVNTVKCFPQSSASNRTTLWRQGGEQSKRGLTGHLATGLLPMTLCLPLLLVGCSGADDDASPSPEVTETPASPTPQPTVTWYGQIQPVVQNACIQCHVTGGIAPFSLETYETAKVWAPVMNKEVQAGSMPPWMPASDCQSFAYARVLTAEEKTLFATWYEEGAPEGQPGQAPAHASPADAPVLGWVDDSLVMDKAYTPPSNTSDQYQCFLLDPALQADQNVVGFEVLPGALSEVHHVLVYAVDKDAAIASDAADPAVGYECFGGPGIDGASLVGAWVPGAGATILPEGTGLPLLAGKVLVMQIHYNMDYSAPVPDQTGINLQFARSTVIQGLMTPISQNKFTIPAGATGYEVSASYTLSAAVKLWGLAPHMHQLGREISVTLTQNGKDSCLVDIPKWDFHWQQFYFYDQNRYIQGKKGDSVKVTCIYDNTTDMAVSHGEGTSDEMCLSYFYVTL